MQLIVWSHDKLLTQTMDISKGVAYVCYNQEIEHNEQCLPSQMGDDVLNNPAQVWKQTFI